MYGVKAKKVGRRMKMIDIIIVFAAFAWAILMIALSKDDKMIGFIAGAFILVLGIFSFIYGIGTVNNELTRAFGYVHIGIGLIVCIVAGVEAIQED